MALNNTLVYLVVLSTLFSGSYSRSVQSQVSQDYNTTSNSTVPTGSSSSPYQGLTPVVITCAVLLQVLLLPLFYCFCYRWCKACCKDVDKKRNEKIRRETWGEGIIERYEVGGSCCRLLSLHFYLSFFLWFVYLICYNVLDWSTYGVVFKNLHIMAIVVIVFSFLVVLLESLISRENAHLENVMQEDDVLNYIKRMRNKAPVITMTVECSHSEDRPKSNGKGTTLKKIVTFTGSREFSYGSWEDVSSVEMPWISHLALTRLKIDAFIEFGDEETKEDFEHQRRAYYDAYQYFDKNFAFKIDHEIPGLETRVLAYVDASQKDGWISEKYFWCATCFCLTWPYRWLFRAKTAKSRYDLKKKMYKSARPSSEVNIMSPASVSPVPESNVNPSISMSKLPSNATQAFPDPTSIPSSHETDLQTNQVPPFPETTSEPVYPPTNEGKLFLPTNQEPPYYPTNLQPYAPLMLQEEPDIPPPCYDLAVQK